MRLLARILMAAFAAVMLAVPSVAQEAKGDWEGALQVNPTIKLRLAVHIVAEPDG